MWCYKRPKYLRYRETWCLSTVIRYKTPFVIQGRTLTLDYALGKDVLVNSILGIPIIAEYQLELKFRPYPHISSSILERVFKVELREASNAPLLEEEVNTDMDEDDNEMVKHNISHDTKSFRSP